MIDSQTVSKILDAAQIVDVVSDFVTLRKRGVNYLGLCPFHDEKTGSFTVSPAKGIFKCFGCGKGGSAVHFIMEHEHLDYPDALRYLAKKYHIEIVEKELSAEDKARQSDRESLFALNEYANRYFQHQLHEHQDGVAIGISYFRSRGFSDSTIKKFQLGYCLEEPGAFAKEALKNGYKEEFLIKSGLSMRSDNGNGNFYDRFRGRVMFPVHTLSGKVVAFGGRILKKNDKAAKYLNSPESEIYHKSNELYGIFFAKHNIVKHDRVFLVEGYTDVISMHQAGIENVVASSGTALTPGQIKLLHRFTPNITVLYDGDNAGIKASLRGIDLLLEEGMNVKVVLLPDGEDPDSFAQSRNADEFIQFIDKNQVDFLRFKTNLLMKDAENDPIKKSQLIHDIVKSLSLIPDKITCDIYIKECSSMMDIEEKLLRNEVQKQLEKKQAEVIKQQEQQKRQQQYRPISTTPSTGDTPPMNDSMIPPPPEGDYGIPSMDYPGIPSEELPINDTIFTHTPTTQFDKEEKNILEFLVRYGEQNVFKFEKEGQEHIEENKREYDQITVGDYFLSIIHDEHIQFSNPLHAKMIEAYANNFSNSGLTASMFFISHPDADISRLAADLVSDRYQLSRIHRRLEEIPPTFDMEEPKVADLDEIYEYESAKKEFEKEMKMFEERQHNAFIEWLGHGACRVINEYTQAVILEEIKQKTLSLRLPENQNQEAMKQILLEISQLNEKKKDFSKALGDRVIIKI